MFNDSLVMFVLKVTFLLDFIILTELSSAHEKNYQKKKTQLIGERQTKCIWQKGVDKLDKK
jgi:hypothetical protein